MGHPAAAEPVTAAAIPLAAASSGNVRRRLLRPHVRLLGHTGVRQVRMFQPPEYLWLRLRWLRRVRFVLTIILTPSTIARGVAASVAATSTAANSSPSPPLDDAPPFPPPPLAATATPHAKTTSHA